MTLSSPQSSPGQLISSGDSDVLSQLAHTGVIPVVTVHTTDQALVVAEALIAGGLPAAEITFRTPVAAEAIAAVTAEKLPLAIGAGTVLSSDQVDAAAEAGATFIVSPGTDPSILERAAAHDLPAIPGAVTATEVQRAHSWGVRTVKFFPAGTSGGAAAVAALAAPFVDMRFIPTGGISLNNLGDYLRLPSVLAAGGSWMVPAALIETRNHSELKALALATSSAVRSLRE